MDDRLSFDLKDQQDKGWVEIREIIGPCIQITPSTITKEYFTNCIALIRTGGFHIDMFNKMIDTVKKDYPEIPREDWTFIELTEKTGWVEWGILLDEVPFVPGYTKPDKDFEFFNEF